MSRKDDVERLARFMGWEYEPGKFRITDICFSVKMLQAHFDPFTRLDDAMAVAEKIKSPYFVLVRGAGHKWSVTIGNDPSDAVRVLAKTLAEAIALAALAYLSATEGK